MKNNFKFKIFIIAPILFFQLILFIACPRKTVDSEQVVWSPKAESSNYYVSNGVSKIRQGDYSGAISDFTKAIELNPKNVPAYTNRGNAKHKQGDYSGAVSDYTKAIELNPEKVLAYIGRGVSKVNLGDNSGAISDYTKAIELNPENSEAYTNRGIAKHRQGHYSGAVSDYTKAIELNPEKTLAYIGRGAAKFNQFDYSGAISDYTKAIELNPGNAEAYKNRGYAFDITKKFELAIKDFRKTLVLNPNDERSKRNLENLFNDLSKNPKFITKMQSILSTRGYYKGEIDGVMRPMVQAAIVNFQTAYNLPQTGKIDNETHYALAEEQLERHKAAGKYYALLIGNNSYRYLKELSTAKHDAEQVGIVLESRYGFSIKLLMDATREDIVLALNRFRSMLREDDSFLIYYAGHGLFDKKADKAYWLPVDARRDDDTNWIIVDTITSNIKRISSIHILIIADSCYSGTLTRGVVVELIPDQKRRRYLSKAKAKRSRTLLASGGNEPIWDGGGKGHSIFASTLLRGLAGIDHKEFTAEELYYKHIKEVVAGSSDQTPEYHIIRNSGHEGGDFVFIRKN